MRFRSIPLCCLLWAGIASAAPVTYQMNFTPTYWEAPTGQFTYDAVANTISDFTVKFFGVTHDFTSQANAPSISALCTSAPASAAVTFAYLSGTSCGPVSWASFTFASGPSVNRYEFYFGQLSRDGFQMAQSLSNGPPTDYGLRDLGTFTISAANAVPEPASLALFGLGAAMVAIGRRRRRSVEANK